MKKITKIITLCGIAINSLAPLQAQDSSEKVDLNDPERSYFFKSRGDGTRTITTAEKKKILELFQKQAKEEKLPKKYIDLVTSGTIIDNTLLSESNFGERFFVYYQNGLNISLFVKDGKASITLDRYLVHKEDIINPIPKPSNTTNPITKEPYFSLDKKLKGKLENPERTLLIQQILSSNFAMLMINYQIDKKAYESGSLFTKILHVPAITFDKQPPKLEKEISEEERKIRERLGYYVGDIVYITGLDTTSVATEPFTNETNFIIYQGMKRTSIVKIDVHSRFSFSYHGLCSTKRYEATKNSLQIEQIANSIKALNQMKEGLIAMTEEAGINRLDKDAELTADEEALAGWCNAMERYMLWITAAKIDNGLISDKELASLKTLAKYIGKENGKIITEAEVDKIEAWGEKLVKKRK